MKKFLVTIVLLSIVNFLFADIPAGYYDDATGSGYTLKTQLHNIIDDHTSLSYSGLWTAMQTTDKKANGYVWDMYSDVPGGSPDYDYTFVSDQCGNYSGEGSCYNREHSFPKSWFNDATPMYTDLFHLYPTDGYVNGKRSNYPFGEVGSASWASTNGSKLGTSDFAGYSGTVFEPIDEYKGDFARSYFYMATRYEDVISTWPGSDMLDGSSNKCFTDWALALLISWNISDPVSQKEIDRNEAVQSFQHNRNPFIDHPEYVAQIWGGGGNILPSISNIIITPEDPTSTDNVSITATISDADGNISSAELHWGISSGSLINTITFTNTSGNIYTTSSTIPAQIDGTTIYFEIEATDDEPKTKTTPVQNYNVSDNPLITILSEDFSTCPASGWTTYSIASNEDWSCTSGFMEINAYGSDAACNDWLISPAIDLNSYSNEILTFISWTRFSDTYNPPVELKYSTNYSGSGDPSSADWTNLSAVWSPQDSQTNTNSGDIDLSAISGNSVYIAVKYISSGTGAGTSAWWKLDDFLITGNNAASGNNLPVISNIEFTPTTPVSTENVAISAIITDSDGSISSADLKWGTSAGSYPNTISMTNSGDDYFAEIPMQSNESQIYFKIFASDNESGSNQSSEYNYTVNILPVISNISVSPENPIENDAVTISATIIDSDGSISETYLKWGTESGSYPNTLSMTVSGDNYSGEIPAQIANTVVYYRIETTDNLLEKTDYTNSYSVSESTGVPIFSSDKLKVYPNPAKETLYIELSENETIETIKLYDVVGEKVFEVSGINSSETSVNLSSFTKGIYFIQVENANDRFVKKIMIE